MKVILYQVKKKEKEKKFMKTEIIILAILKKEGAKEKDNYLTKIKDYFMKVHLKMIKKKDLERRFYNSKNIILANLLAELNLVKEKYMTKMIY